MLWQFHCQTFGDRFEYQYSSEMTLQVEVRCGTLTKTHFLALIAEHRSKFVAELAISWFSILPFCQIHTLYFVLFAKQHLTIISSLLAQRHIVQYWPNKMAMNGLYILLECEVFQTSLNKGIIIVAWEVFDCATKITDIFYDWKMFW